MTKTLQTMGLGVLALFLAVPLATSLVPELASAFGQLLAVVSTAVLTLAPKVALMGFVLGGTLGIFHWTRKHAWPMIKWSLIAGVLGSVATVVFAWVGNEAMTAAPTAAGVASQLVSKVLAGLGAGLG